MKFTIDQEIFSGLLQQHLPVIPPRSALPILNSIRWELGKGRLKIHSTDLEISLITESDVESEGEGSVAVPAKKISEIVHELPNEPVSVEIEDNFRVKIRGVSGIYQVAGSDSADFPPILGEGMEAKVVMSGEKFKRMINRTTFAVSRDDMRPTLCGVFFQVLPDDIRMVATDGHRLAKLVDNSYNGEGTAYEAIIPVKAFQLAVKTIGDDEEVHISASKNYLRLEMPNSSLYSRLIEGKYPSYENVIPQENPNILTADVEALTSAVRRVAIFSNSLTRQVKFSLTADKMILTAEDVETGGEAEEEINVDYQGEEMLIGYNANYVMDALRKIDTEEVKFLVGTKDSASIVEPTEQASDEEFMMLLMPVRLQ